MSETSPRIDGLTQTIIHPDGPNDVPWIAVRSQRNADGSESHVWERWVAFSVEPLYLALFARWDPGMIVRRHGHHSPHLVFVLEGELWVDDRRCPAGTHIELPYGAAFGPLRAGDEGAVLFEVMLGDPRSWGDQPERYESAMAERGVEPLPDVPLDYPDWLTDLRQHWAP